jgi:hypothetical protein
MGTILPANSAQMSLSFEQGLSAKHMSLRSCMAAGVYQRGLVAVAGKIDASPSKLCEKLAGGAGDRPRDVGLDEFETYLEKTGDRTPIYYLIDKFLSDPQVRQEMAMSRALELLEQLGPAFAAAGVKVGGKKVP